MTAPRMRPGTDQRTGRGDGVDGSGKQVGGTRPPVDPGGTQIERLMSGSADNTPDQSPDEAGCVDQPGVPVMNGGTQS